MMAIPMSAAASGLLRAMLNRAKVPRDRILLTEFRSTDWQSLTFVGERHEIRLRIPGPAPDEAALRLTNGIGESEFSISGHIVADVAVVGSPTRGDDGSLTLHIEALTIAE